MGKVNNKNILLILQLVGWCVMFGVTFYWSASRELRTFESYRLASFLIDIITLVVVYAVNYIYLIPSYLFNQRRLMFFLYNAVMIALLAIFVHSWMVTDMIDVLRPEGMPPRPGGTAFIRIVQDVINYSLMVGLVTAIRLVQRLEHSEEKLREAESAKVEAELATLRSQINPHFLLNTLNNIYSLTAIDVEQAQDAIKELSRLLQYLLYDNRSDRVSVVSEVKFLKSYIRLMRLRLNKRITLSIDFKVDPGSTTQIAPLIFISLIENAFKHGVSATEESFVEILFEDRVEMGDVRVLIRNSNYATSESDKSGHGVGLEQVRSRLKLLYPGMHLWKIEESEGVYSSELILKVK